MGNNRRIKKGLLLLCLLLVWESGVITGCGKGAREQKKSEEENKVEISVLAKNSWYTNVDYEDSEIINHVIENSGYRVNWKLNAPSNYYDTIRPLLFSKNKLADLIQLPDLDLDAQYLRDGIFVKLDEYLSDMPNFNKYLNNNPDIKASLTAEDGHIYYVPQTTHTKNYQTCIMYNMEWLDKLGLEVPRTLDEFVNVLRAFKNTDMNENGIADEVPMSVTANFLNYMFGPAFGLELVNGFDVGEDGRISYSYENEQYQDYLEFLNNLYREGLLEPEFSSLTRDIIKERCKNNQTGIIFDYSWQMSSLYSAQYPQYNGSEPIFLGAPPLSGKYQGYYIGRNQITGLFGVVTNSDKILDTVRFLDYIMGEEAQNLYSWGIKGESYTVSQSGKKQFTERASDDEWLQKLGINPICMPIQQSVEAADAHLVQWHVENDRKLYDYIKEPFPFIFATAAETEVDHGYTNYVAGYVSQEEISFIEGKSSMKSYPQYLQTLKNMGIDSIVEVKQQQYDRYRQNNSK